MSANIRLLAIDLDGTLFGDSLHPTARVRDAVRAAAAAGVKITIASGRTTPDEERVIHELGLTAAQTAPLIGYQGAYVYQPGYGELFSFTLAPDVAICIVEYSRSIGYGVNLHTPEDTFVERPTAADHYYAELSLLKPITVADMAAIIRERDLHPLKMVLVSQLQEQTNRLVDALNQLWPQQLVAARSHPRFCEATHPCANKGEALSQLAARLGIPMSEVMAIGDNQNDITMLQRAGVGVAMGHAAPEVKAAAAYVTGTLQEDGVASAIQRFILERA